MTNAVDGSVIIDTGLDNTGVKMGAKELQRHINSLVSSVNRFGTQLQKAAAGYSDSVNEVLSRSFTNNIEGIRAKLEALGKTQIPTEDYKALNAELEKTGKKLENLLTRQEKLDEMGVSHNSAQWKSLQYDIDQTGKKYDDFVAAKERMEANGLAFTSGSTTEEYQRLSEELGTLENGMSAGATRGQVFHGVMQSLGNVIKTVAEHALSLGRRVAQISFSAITSGAKKAVTGLKSFVSFIRKSVSGLKSFRSQTRKTDLASSGLVKSLTSLKRLLITRVKRMFISAIFNNVREGIRELAKFSSAFNTQMSNMKNSATQLSGNISVLLGNAISVIEPVITRIINVMAQGVDWINQFIATLQGKSTYTSAKKGAESYADATDKAASAQKKLNRELYSFDELNRQGDYSNNNNTDASAITFEEKTINLPSAVTDWIERLKEAWKKADWSGLGKVVADGVNAVFGKLDELISWENVGGTITKIVNAITSFINSAVSNIDWELIGRTFGSGINTLVNTLYLFFTGIDWTAIGKALATGLNGLVGRVDWDRLGRLFGARINALFDTIRGFASNFKWDEAGTAFASAVNGLKNQVNWFTLGDSLKKLLKGAIALMQNAVKTIEWGDAGTKFAEALNAFFAQDSLWADAGNTIDTTIKGLLDFTEKAIITFDEVQFADDLKALFGNVDWDGIARNTWNLMKTAFQKMGSFVNALLNEPIDPEKAGMSGAYLAKVTEFNQKSLGEKLGIRLREAFESIPWANIASELWEAAKVAFKNAGDFVLSIFGIDKNVIEKYGVDKFEAIGTVIGNTLAKIPWSTAINSIIPKITGAITGIMDGLFKENTGIIPLAVLAGFATLKAVTHTQLLSLKSAIILDLAAIVLATSSYVINRIKEIGENIDNQEKAVTHTLASTMKTYVDTVKEGNIEAANDFVNQLYGINVEGNNIAGNLEKIMQGVSDYFGVELFGMSNDAELAMTLYRDIFNEYGAEAANSFAETVYGISLTGENWKENMYTLEKEVQKAIDNGALFLYKPEIATQNEETAEKYTDAYFEAFKEEVMDNGHVIKAYKSSLEEIYGSVDGFEDGSLSASDFFDGWNNGVEGKKTPTAQLLQSVMDWVVSQMEKDTLEQGSPSKRAQRSGEYYMEGFTEGTESKEEDAKGRTAGVFESIFGKIVSTAVTLTLLNVAVNAAMDSMANKIETTLNGVDSKFTDTLNSIKNRDWHGLGEGVVNGIRNGINDGKYWLGRTADDVADNVRNSFNNENWWSVGDNIVAGIQEGVKDNWKWLQNTVKNLAKSLYNTAKDTLGIHSPSTVFAEIGNFVDAGLQQGLKDGERDVLQTAANIADAVTNEMTPDSPEVDVTAEGLIGGVQAVISGLDGVADTFKVILDTLRSMGGLLTPQIAMGTVVPYKTKIDSAAADNDLIDTLESLNDDLESVIIQVVNNAVVALVDAIQKGRSGGESLDDLNAQTKRVIDEINRRARAQGSSPILV